MCQSPVDNLPRLADAPFDIVPSLKSEVIHACRCPFSVVAQECDTRSMSDLISVLGCGVSAATHVNMYYIVGGTFHCQTCMYNSFPKASGSIRLAF